MSLAASRCSRLIVTREARLGLNGPQVIEQEAGIAEYDSRNRPFIWSLTGGEARARNGFVDYLAEDSLKDIRKAVIDYINQGCPEILRNEQYDEYLNKLSSFDTTKQVDADMVTALFARGA